MHAVLQLLEEEADIMRHSTVPLTVVEESRPRCNVCGSWNVGRAGKTFRATRQDIVQAYKCRRCGSTWRAGTFRGCWLPYDFVKPALDMARLGFSHRTIAMAVAEWSGRETVTGTTIANWVRRFGVEEPVSRPREPGKELLEAVKKQSKGPWVRLSDFGLMRRVKFGPEIRLKTKGYLSENGLYTVRECTRVARKLGVPLDALERYVVSVSAGVSGRSKPMNVTLPFQASGGHAFLLGLFHASGGIGGNTLHFAIDREVGEHLQSPRFINQVHETPVAVSQGKKPHGTRSYTYSLVMLDVLKALGLRTVKPIQLGDGKFVPSRHLTMVVPSWVRRELPSLHAFTEGYINGIKTTAGLAGREERRGLGSTPYLVTYSNVKVSFCNYNKQDLDRFVGIVVRHFRDLGVDGWLSRTRYDGRRMHHYSYAFHTLPQLAAFNARFMILRPMVRIKLALRLSKDPILNHITQRIRDIDAYVLGTVLEGPKTVPELAVLSPRRPYNMTTEQFLGPSVSRLVRMGVLKKAGNLLKYEPTVFATELAREYASRAKKKSDMKKSLDGKPLYYCPGCRAVGDTPKCVSCGALRPRCTKAELRRLWDPKAESIARSLLMAIPGGQR
ncbi:MAG: IS1 family transposase [Nitrososphaerota archaeon]|nr:IS1 family transposase [Nitrososphaerota archaeon]